MNGTPEEPHIGVPGQSEHTDLPGQAAGEGHRIVQVGVGMPGDEVVECRGALADRPAPGHRGRARRGGGGDRHERTGACSERPPGPGRRFSGGTGCVSPSREGESAEFPEYSCSRRASFPERASFRHHKLRNLPGLACHDKVTAPVGATGHDDTANAV